jgi:mannitol-specific phosphotransferase system IIBC component
MKKLLSVLFAAAVVFSLTARVFAQAYNSAQGQSAVQHQEAEMLEKKHHKKKHKHPKPVSDRDTGEVTTGLPFSHS